jgi:hypothetical protein
VVKKRSVERQREKEGKNQAAERKGEKAGGASSADEDEDDLKKHITAKVKCPPLDDRNEINRFDPPPISQEPIRYSQMSKFVWIAIAGATVICIILAVALRVSRANSCNSRSNANGLASLLSRYPSMLRAYFSHSCCDDEWVLGLITSYIMFCCGTGLVPQEGKDDAQQGYV